MFAHSTRVFVISLLLLEILLCISVKNTEVGFGRKRPKCKKLVNALKAINLTWPHGYYFNNNKSW